MRCPTCGKEVMCCCERNETTEQGKLFHAVATLLKSEGVRESAATHERYTPPELAKLARKVLGSIELDPASSAEANETIKAKRFYDKGTNGLAQPWAGRVFLNPPFDDWPAWITKLESETEVTEAVVIGPSNLSAFRPLLRRGGLLCVPDERPRYRTPDNRLIDPPFGSLIGYVGERGDRFAEMFRSVGLILQPVV